jgi:hypothetical protein
MRRRGHALLIGFFRKFLEEFSSELSIPEALISGESIRIVDRNSQSPMEQTVWRNTLLQKIDSFLEREWGEVDSQLGQALDHLPLDAEGFERVLDRVSGGGIPGLELREQLQKEPQALRPGNEILQEVQNWVGGDRLLIIRGWGRNEPRLDPALASILGTLICGIGSFTQRGGAVEISPNGEGALGLSFFGPSNWGESWKGPEEVFGCFLAKALGAVVPCQEEMESGDFRFELPLPVDAYATNSYPNA